MDVKGFLSKVNRTQEDFKLTEEQLLSNMYLSERRIENLVETIKQFGDSKSSDEYIKKILGNPSNKNGTIYEILGYKWLYDHYVNFDLHPILKKADCLKDKSDNYVADGKIENIVFDIKAFGFGMPRYMDFSDKLNLLISERKSVKVSDFIKNSDSDDDDVEANSNKSVVLGDYFITISGTADLSSKDFESMMGNGIQILRELFSREANYMDYMYKLGSLELRAHYRKKVISSISSFNSEEWAMNNQYQLIKHGSQFSKNSPFIIICTYDDYKCNRLFGTNDRQYAFRSLCRRMFMFHTKIENRMLCEFDGKADRRISVAAAAKKLSGVLFLDVSDNPERFGDSLFLNPNADNPLCGYQVDIYFGCNGVTVENYRYDNY